MKAPRLSTREQVLAAVGPFLLLATFLLFFRVLPHRKALLGLEPQLAAAMAPRATPPPDLEAARLLARRDEIKRRVEAERASFAKLDRLFPKDEAAALSAISALAEQTGVLIRESEPYHGDNGAGDRDDFTRPRRRFVAVATFASMRSFIAGLGSLPENPVHFEKLDLATVSVPAPAVPDEADAPEDVSVLVGTFVLVL